MNWQTILDPTVCGRLCMTLVHSLWQVAILAAVAWSAGRLLFQRSPRVAYAMHVAALLIALAAMPITFALVDVGSTSKLYEESAARTSAQVRTVVSNEPSAAEETPARGDVVPVAPAANRVAANPRSSFGSPAPASVKRTAEAAPIAQESSSERPQEEPSLLWPRVAPWLAAAYALGVLLMLARLLRGMWTAQRLAARAERVDNGPLADRVKSLAAAWSVRVVPLLAKSEAVVVPKVIGLLRPMILLPVSAVGGLSTEELEMILAHELAHVRRYDMWVNLLQRMAEAVLFFNPALWILSRRISTLREYCCDELTCGTPLGTCDTELRARYASALLRVVEVSGRTPEPADIATLAAARTPSELRRRVSRLFGEPLPEPVRLSRGGLCTIAVLAAFFLLAPTVWHSVPESVAAPEEAGEGDAEGEEAVRGGHDSIRLPIHVTSESSGEPLAGVCFRFCGRVGGDRLDERVETNREGLAEFEREGSAEVQYLWFTAEKPGFVPIHYVWRNDIKPIELPERLDLAMSEGRHIAGRVEDEQGKPIAGATVELTMPVTWPRLASHVFYAAELKADEDGRWSWDGAPQSARDIGIRITHVEFLGGGARASDSSATVTVLKRGLTVRGRVLDSQGTPIAGATAQLGFDRFGTGQPKATTDEGGYFIIEKCKAEPSAVTVQADGFSPEIRQITIGQAVDSVEFTLAPGNVLRGKVVDVEGKPVSGAIVVPDTWRGFRTLDKRLTTDAEGRFEWCGAPPDAVAYDILKEGHMANRNLALIAAAEEQVITLHPELWITGRVTDAKTGEPIKEFSIRYGYLFANSDSTHWSEDEPTAYANGEYRYKFDEPMQGYLLQVVAKGHTPQTSRVFRSDEGGVEFHFELEQGEGPTGRVVAPDGTPAAGAEVGLATAEKRACLSAGHFDRSQNRADVVAADEDGRFAFIARDDEPFIVIAVHDAGFAEVKGDALKDATPIKLEPWGKLRGRVVLGTKPDAGREISFSPKRPDDFNRWNFVWDYGYRATTDEDGRFEFDRVVPGPGIVARTVVTEFGGGSSQHATGWQTPVSVAPKETIEVVIGGTGRPVIGKVVLDEKPEDAVNWTANEPAAVLRWDKEEGRRADPYSPFYGNIDQSGVFRIPDVPSGDYQLTIPVNGPKVPNTCGSGAEIGKAEIVFTVPPMPSGRSDEPLDLGTITAKVFDTLDVGETAPDFAIENLRGGTIRLSKLRGKLVLLDFWATWCGPCLAEMPAFKAIQKEHGDNPRFALVSISCDNEAAAPRGYVEENGLDWRQSQIPGIQSKVARDYQVKSLPTTFLIAPNGTVLAKNLRGEALKQAVSATLKDDTLFAGEFDTRPQRFPVVRFEVNEVEQAVPAPAILVLDDVDPKFDKDVPHHDGLRAFDAEGKELWAHEDFNNAEGYGCRAAADRERGRVYVCETVTNRITAFDLAGGKRWKIDNVEVNTLLVDPRTGNLWCSGGSGHTVVFDQDGNELAAYPWRARGMTYDPHTDSFWLAGYEILKLSRDGEVLFREPVDGWCCGAVAVNPENGHVWIAERRHPDVPKSANRLWLRGADGKVLRKVELGDSDAFVVGCEPRTGDALLGGYKTPLTRISTGGETHKVLDVQIRNIAVSPTTGAIWVATEEAVLRLDEAGNIKVTIPFTAKSGQSWIAAF